MKQPLYLWETHLHTAETSRCAQSPAADMARAYKRAGYHGIVVTDHFLNGNNLAPQKASWQKRVDIMLRGYRAAKEAGDAIGLHVLLGWEFTDRCADFLTYGLDEAFLRDQPDLASLDVDAYVQRVHGAGGFVSQAHPFRQAWYMQHNVARRWDIVDALEVYNGSHSPSQRHWDDQALELAESHQLIQTAGSDAHSAADAATAAVGFDEPFSTSRELIIALHSCKGTILRGHYP